jgi:hypothetical protein
LRACSCPIITMLYCNTMQLLPQSICCILTLCCSIVTHCCYFVKLCCSMVTYCCSIVTHAVIL